MGNIKSKAFKENLGEIKTNNLVKQALIEKGFSEDLEIKRYILDDDILSYYVTFQATYHDQPVKKLIILNYQDYTNLLKEKLSPEDSNNCIIYPIISDDKIAYNITIFGEKAMVKKMGRGKR